MKNNYTSLLIFSFIFLFTNCDRAPINFSSTPKIDAHAHFETDESTFIELAQKENMSFLSITTHSHSRYYIDKQLNHAVNLKKNTPENFYFTTTFSMENFDTPEWENDVITKLKEDFSRGAIAVKVWKDIGMTYRDKDSSFIMIDDPRFDKILEFIAANNKPLVAHIAEPRNCWLPIDSMTVNNDKKYFKNHPEYHMYQHPDYPSYEEIIQHRDRMLEKHPSMKVIGCHLGSLEWNTDELAKRFDKYPNFSVDLSARICHLQVQDREKVRDFIIKYQDRILYGTDNEVHEKDNQAERYKQTREIWLADWEYFTTDNTMSSNIVNNPFQGLKLPEKVIRKIYYKNAKRWYPEIK
jgi:predicted TIM-barrel fold metal-dependent hydrolase